MRISLLPVILLGFSRQLTVYPLLSCRKDMPLNEAKRLCLDYGVSVASSDDFCKMQEVCSPFACP